MLDVSIYGTVVYDTNQKSNLKLLRKPYAKKAPIIVKKFFVVSKISSNFTNFKLAAHFPSCKQVTTLIGLVTRKALLLKNSVTPPIYFIVL